MTNALKREPLYVAPDERVTLDGLKQRVGQIQDHALTQTKQVVHEVYEKDVTRAALVAVGVVIVAASLAYYLGTRAARRVAIPGAE